MKVVSLVGARPQFIKEAMVNAEVRKANAWRHILVHSGQHYDFNMSEAFFEELEIPHPDYWLGIESGSQAAQTADAILKFNEVLLEEKPDLVLLYGDTNTTLAGAIDASKLHIPIAHVEAGPRTYNKLYPEEVNRVLTDHVSDLLFACTELNVQNLRKEGIVEGICLAGDVMYDLYLKLGRRWEPERVRARYGLGEGGYVVATIHRDFNTDRRDRLQGILRGLALIADGYGLAVLFPMHPRTRKKVAEFGLEGALEKFVVTEPLGYVELMSLTLDAAFVVTDSGGYQKEAYWAKKRGLLPIPQGWTEIIETGWHCLVSDPDVADWDRAVREILTEHPYPQNLFGDGHAAEKIVQYIQSWSQPQTPTLGVRS